MIIKNRNELESLINTSYVKENDGNQYFEFDDYLLSNHLVNKFEIDILVQEAMSNVLEDQVNLLDNLISNYNLNEFESNCASEGENCAGKMNINYAEAA